MKIRTRKRTAAEKARDKAKKEQKKALKEEKKQVKKDAREDKRGARKTAKDEKKDIRNSNLSQKEKNEAKKAVNKGKKDVIKDINRDKKGEVKDVNEDLKEVRKSLEIILPAKTANVALLRQDLRDITFNDGNELRSITIEDAYPILNKAYRISIDLAESALEYIRPFVVLSQRASWIRNWNNDDLLIQWFGEIDKVNNASDVFNRMNSVVERLNSKITIRLHPQRSGTTNAQNMGTFFEPKMFKVFPRLIKNSLDETTSEINYDYIASVMIHELIHVWFTDQKLDGKTVYGEDLVMELAAENPKKARRSAENYEHFCISFA